MDKSGLIMVSGGSGFVSKLITWFTESEATHGAMTYIASTGNDEDIVLTQCTGQGCNSKGTLKHYLNNKYWIKFYKVPWDEKRIAELKNEIDKYKHVPYGVFQLIGMAIPTLFQKLGLKLKSWVGLGIVCSIYVWHLLDAGLKKDSYLYEKIKKIDKDLFSPKVLLNSLDFSKDVILVGEKKKEDLTITWFG